MPARGRTVARGHLPDEWLAEPGPQTDKTRRTVKEFIVRQLRA
jgi:hypothetical protein